MDRELKIRYSRQIAVEEIGEEGQNRLRGAKVMIVGCGALGSMVAMQLCAAGVGEIVIADFDTIDISNLQRQLFFKSSEAGSGKASVLSQRMAELNPDCHVSVVTGMIGKEDARSLFASCDYVIDATDNAPSKILVEETCVSLGIGYCLAGVTGFRGQVFTSGDGRSKFSDIFPVDDESDFMPCGIAGVLGPTAALCASMQSMAAIKHIVGLPEGGKTELIVFNLLDNIFNVYRL